MSRTQQIIGLAGLAGAGKSTSALTIVAEFGFVGIKLGDHIRQELIAKGLAYTPENERAIQIELREQYGMAALVKLSMRRIQEELDKGNSILLDSMCSFSEREYIRSAIVSVPCTVIAVHAALLDRMNRLAVRPERPLKVEQMLERDALEIDRLEKARLLTLADFHLANNGDVDMLAAATQSILQRILRGA